MAKKKLTYIKVAIPLSGVAFFIETTQGLDVRDIYLVPLLYTQTDLLLWVGVQLDCTLTQEVSQYINENRLVKL